MREKRMSKILAITGASGKSGSVFCRIISENVEAVSKMFPGGVRLIMHSDKPTPLDDTRELSVTKVLGNLEDEGFVTDALEGVDTLVHIAGIHWSREVAAACVKRNVRRLIAVHTTGIYSKYKEAGEEYRHIDDFCYKACKDGNIALTILRPTMIYGSPYDKNVIKFIKMVDKFPIMPTVNGARYNLQPVHFADLGKAYYDVLTNESTAGKDYILSGKEPIMLRDMFTEIGKCLGKKVRFVSVPFWLAYPGAVVLYFVSLKRIDMREKVQRLCEPRAYSHEDAARDFGYEPRPFSDGIDDEVKQYLSMKQ